MPLSKITLQTLTERMINDVQSSFNSSTFAQKSYIRNLVKSIAGGVYLLFGFHEQLVKQCHPLTATENFLDLWANLYLDVQRKEGSFAIGDVVFSGANGTVIPAGLELIKDDVVYLTTESGVIASGTATIEIEAQVEGIKGNLTTIDQLSVISNILGLDNTVTVSIAITNGVDRETDDALRERLHQRIQNPPHGGNASDYERWALEVSGIRKCFVFGSSPSAGDVTLVLLDDNLEPPITNKLNEVKDYISDPTRKPVTANVIAAAPSLLDVDFTIHINPDTTANRQAVTENLQALILKEGKPSGTIYLSQIREAISAAGTEIDNTVTVPSANVTTTQAQYPVFGTITWV